MEQNWVRIEILQALRQGYNGKDEQVSIEQQADAMMTLIERIASEADTFHMLVGYLNDIRLDKYRERQTKDELDKYRERQTKDESDGPGSAST